MSHRSHLRTALKALVLAGLAPLAFVGLGLARAAVLLLPFPRLSRWLGASIGAVALMPLATPAQMRRASLIGRVIGKMARYTPWNSNCLAQALLARMLLGALHIPYALHLGLLPKAVAPGETLAHAWVVCGRVFVTGDNGFANYPVVAVFVSAGLASSDAASSPTISVSRWRS